MTRDEAVQILGDHADALRARGVTRLALFGSTLRGDSRLDSDVDLLVDIDRSRKFSMLDHAGLEIFLSEILGRPADIAMRDRLKPLLREPILAEAEDVF